MSPAALAVPFNGAVEIGLRALCLLTAAFPTSYGLRQLTAFDYMLVHSDDLPDGPPGLHPQTPGREGELLTRRGVLQEGLMLYQSRGLVERRFEETGLFFAATDRSAAFLDVLDAPYVIVLRARALWVVEQFGQLDEGAISTLVAARIGEWAQNSRCSPCYSRTT